MEDTIQGSVINIVDGDTFDMKVTRAGAGNEYTYNSEERIRIASIDEPELDTPSGVRSKDAVERKLLGKEVRCYIKSRDIYGRVIADVRVL